MEDYRPQFGGKADIIPVMILLIVGAAIGLAVGSMSIYGYIQHGGMESHQANITAP